MFVIYVDVNNVYGPHDGNSWSTAFNDLQNALDIAETNPGTKILVAEGIYIPSKIYSPNGIPGGSASITYPNIISPNMFTFNIPNNTTLIGGFCGKKYNSCRCNCSCSERDVKKYKTFLSGGNISWHVVILGNDVAHTGVFVVIDGFIITQGNAQGPIFNNTIVTEFMYAHSYGAGIYSIFGSSLTLKNTILKMNNANGIGGGIFSISSDILIKKSIFCNNISNQQAGALAIYNTYESISHFAKVINSTFDNNKSVDFGGAIVIEGTLQNSLTSSILINCIFTNNYALEGGAVVVDSEQTDINYCKFIKNSSAVNAGAIATTNIVNTIASAIANPPVPLILTTTNINNCLFEDNITLGNQPLRDFLQFMVAGPADGINFPLGGGAVVCYMNGLLNINDSKFINNTALNSNGGAILNGKSSASSPLGIPGITAFAVTTNISRCVFEANSAVDGGAISSEPSTFVFVPPLNITVADTVLNTSCSSFINNKALGNGGAIYLNKTTATLNGNDFTCNIANNGKNIYASNSIINGTSQILYIKNC